jgi:hypothetical protein
LRRGRHPRKGKSARQSVLQLVILHAGAVDTKMVKTVGEHWVCATLARHGWAPALTRDGLERTDILSQSTAREEGATDLKVI